MTTHRFHRALATQLVAAGIDVFMATRRMDHTKEVMFGHYLLGAEETSVAGAEVPEARLLGHGLPISEVCTRSLPPAPQTEERS
jgi:hypothetical protein